MLVEDERTAVAMGRHAHLSTIVAIARVLNARRALEAKYGGKGEVRYASHAMPPPFLVEAVQRAGGALADGTGEKVLVPAQPAAVSSVIDHAFAELAHHVRSSVGAHDVVTALKKTEANRRKAPLDKDANPAAYWAAVFELAALAGELSRAKGGRWIETKEMPVPFAIKIASGEIAVPSKLAQQIVEGTAPDESLAAPPEAAPPKPPSEPPPDAPPTA